MRAQTATPAPRKPRTKAPALPAFTPYRVPEPETHPQGQWPLLALHTGQCRYACDEVDGQHRFCGAKTEIGAGNLHRSWCEAHRAVVFRSGSVSGEGE